MITVKRGPCMALFYPTGVTCRPCRRGRRRRRHAAGQTYDAGVPEWPAITEPELLARLGLTDDEFRTTIAAAIRQMPAREPDAAIMERAKGYPWWRPEHSYVLTDGAVQPLEGATPEERAPVLRRFLADHGPQSRVRVLAIGSNAAPETLTLKFAHFPDEDDRTVLVIAGRLQDF